MAVSTSTSISPYAGAYDVFLNHRGPDVKKGFATDLYRRLISHGLRVFLDYQELNKGEKFDSEIKGAIASASVQVAIFSPQYVDSKWCLDELQLMLDSGALVIPVFYQVEPTDLRRTGERDNGVYAVALRNQLNKKADDGQLRYNSTTVQEWRKTLFRAAEISGFELKAFNDDEGQLLDGVVECVRKRIRKPLLDVAVHPTGLEDKVQDFEREVLSKQQSGRVQVVLIAGQGGAGKTTFAKELYNRKSVNYNKYCFLFDVRENAGKSLVSLQKALLEGLNISDRDVENVDNGKVKLRENLKGSQAVLIVLDDIDNVDQVHALLPLDVLHPNSFILITSRDKNVLATLGKEKPSFYHLTGLDDHHSKKLFCYYAFCQSHPLPGFEYLVDRFLKACQGLPLSLKVIGTLVSGNTEESEWEDQLRKLEQILPHEIQQRLQISYDALDKQEKNMFLDIACFFIGEDRDTAINIWNGSGWSGSVGFRTLQNKCLVEVDMENKMRMHDHLRDLGRDLARHPELPRRLWNIDDLKHHSSVITELRGIQVFLSENRYDRFHQMIRDNEEKDEDEDNDEDGDERNEYFWHRSMMMKLRKKNFRKNLLQLNEVKGSKLQLLDVDYLQEQVLSRVHSPNLVWLRWHECHLFTLPSWIPMEDLRVLEVHGKELKKLWPDEKVPLQLRELRIFAPLQNIPKSIVYLKQLEKLHLDFSCLYFPRDIPKSSPLQELNIGDLSALKEFGIKNSLFNSITGLAELTKLRKVYISYCSYLEELPGFETLRSLEELRVDSCVMLKSIRGSAELTNLQKVHVQYCDDLVELQGFENLKSLEELQVYKCNKLKSIRGSAELTKLRRVYVHDCNSLKELPGFENLRSLEELQVYSCSKLKSIQGSVELTKLRCVYVHHCFSLEELPGFENLSSLEELQVYRCGTLKSIRGSTELTKLRSVDIRDCYNLEELTGFENLSSLEELQVNTCWRLKSIRVSAELRELRKVNISFCSDFEELPGFENLRSLEELHLSDCRKLKSLGGLAELTELRRVHVHGCDLEELRGSENLRSLEKLEVRHCARLKSIRGSADLTKLRRVEVSYCYDLEELPGFENLRSLEELQLDSCTKLKSIPELVELTKLRSVKVDFCSHLEELPGFENLRSLEDLKVLHCRKLKSIRGASGLTKLRCVSIGHCYDLEELLGFENCRLLEELRVYQCGKLKTIPTLTQSTELRKLDVSGCSDLEELPGVESLRSLKCFNISGCVKLKIIPGWAQWTELQELYVCRLPDLEELPGVENLRSLEVLDVSRCVNLKNIPGLTQLTKLRTLNITDCSGLEELPAIEHLGSDLVLQKNVYVSFG